tara:strand:- start:3938 stop:4741 length:804 start_codon:yes stop_codon:yes gene_type:complete
MAHVTVNGQDIYYVDQGQGSPIILIHGLAGDHTAWHPQMEWLKGSYRIVALDNRGAGKSTQRDEPVSTEQMARDVLALMDHLEIDQAQIVGRSMGGAIAQHMALLAPDRVQSLALCASFAKLDPLGKRVLHNMREVLEWTGSWAAHAKHSVQNFVGPTYFNHYPERIRDLETLIGSDTRLQACYVQQNHACQRHDTLERLREISCPTLVMAGECDPICSLTAAQWLVDGIPGARLEVFDDCSHFFLVEQAERFNTMLSGWLRQHCIP